MTERDREKEREEDAEFYMMVAAAFVVMLLVGLLTLVVSVIVNNITTDDINTNGTYQIVEETGTNDTFGFDSLIDIEAKATYIVGEDIDAGTYNILVSRYQSKDIFTKYNSELVYEQLILTEGDMVETNDKDGIVIKNKKDEVKVEISKNLLIDTAFSDSSSHTDSDYRVYLQEVSDNVEIDSSEYIVLTETYYYDDPEPVQIKVYNEEGVLQEEYSYVKDGFPIELKDGSYIQTSSEQNRTIQVSYMNEGKYLRYLENEAEKEAEAEQEELEQEHEENLDWSN